MNWIKRNSLLVAGAVVALALLGVAGYYLFSELERDRTVTEDLATKSDEWTALVKRPVHPGNKKVDNIKATEREAKRVEEEILVPGRKYFGQLDPSNRVEVSQFQLALVSRIAELRRMLTNSGVTLPQQFAFGFSHQERALRPNAAIVQPLMMQLEDITAICRVLFHAKIHRLEGIKRVAVSTNEPADGPDYLPKAYLQMRTNDVVGAVLVPYQIDVVGHSEELAQVLNGFARSPEFFVVKLVDVQPFKQDETSPDGSPMSMTSAPMGRAPGGMDPVLARRYGLGGAGGGRPGAGAGMSPQMMQRYGLGGGRYGGGAGGRPNPYNVQPLVVEGAAQPQVQAGPFLKETPLRMLVVVEAVKLLPPGTVQKRAPAPPPTDAAAEAPAEETTEAAN